MSLNLYSKSAVMICPNCNEEFSQKYCGSCGQHKLEKDRSLTYLLGELFSGMFFVDNRFWLSFRYLLFKPGQMTYDFLDGKRKRFLPPITIFLFINLIYFFASPLTDYSLSLSEQLFQPTHGTLATKLVEQKLQKEGLDMETYAVEYKTMSDNVSKLIMVLNVPLIAVFVFLMSLRRRKYFYDSLVFSLHYFSVFLFYIVLGRLVVQMIIPLVSSKEMGVMLWQLYLSVFVTLIPIIYVIISLVRFNDIKTKWYMVIIPGIIVYAGGWCAQFLYRSIVFFTTFWLT